jgi:hypothetical protein
MQVSAVTGYLDPKVNRIAGAVASARRPCLTPGVRPEDLREFARRSREDVASAKRAHWRAAAQTGDGLAAFDAAQALYEHATSASDFPSVSSRAEDLAHHVRDKRLIDRASQAAPFARATR